MSFKVHNVMINTKMMRINGDIVDNLNNLDILISRPLNNIVGVALKFWTFPNTNPTFTVLNQKIRIYEETNTNYVDYILGNSTNYINIADAFNNQLIVPAIISDLNISYKINYDVNTTLITISSEEGNNFKLDFSYGLEGRHNAALLGFQSKVYTGSNSYTAEFAAHSQSDYYNVVLDCIEPDTSVNGHNEHLIGALYTIMNTNNFTEFLSGSNSIDPSKLDKIRPIKNNKKSCLNSFKLNIYDDSGELATLTGDYYFLIGFIERI